MRIMGKISGALKEFPNEFMREDMAHRNHGQSLSKLDSRGGMGADEIFANLFGLKNGWTKGNFSSKEAGCIDVLEKIVSLVHPEKY